MSFEPRDYLRHMLVEVEYQVDRALRQNERASTVAYLFVVDDQPREREFDEASA